LDSSIAVYEETMPEATRSSRRVSADEPVQAGRLPLPARRNAWYRGCHTARFADTFFRAGL